MVRLIGFASVAVFAFASSSSAIVLPEQASEQALVVVDSEAGNSSVASTEAYGHRLGRRQYASGSETPLWYTGKTDPWASFKSFNWNNWINWGWSGHTLGYVKEWYYDEPVALLLDAERR